MSLNCSVIVVGGGKLIGLRPKLMGTPELKTASVNISFKQFSCKDKGGDGYVGSGFKSLCFPTIKGVMYFNNNERGKTRE